MFQNLPSGYCLRQFFRVEKFLLNDNFYDRLRTLNFRCFVSYFRTEKVRKKDPSKSSNQILVNLCDQVLQQVETSYSTKPNFIFEMWPKIVGEPFCQFSRPVRFEEAILYVQVANSSMMSLLNNPHDKKQLIEAYRARIPNIVLKNINFRIS